jgi:hypothetical protein
MAKKHPMTLAEMEFFSVDENNTLYYKDKKVLTEERITLKWWINLAVMLGGFGAFGNVIIEVLKFIGYGAK